MLAKGKQKRNDNPDVTVVDIVAYAKALGFDLDPEKDSDLLEFISRMMDHPLPEPWVNHANIKGQVFYFNKHTRESTWHHPLITSHIDLVHSYRFIMKATNRDAAIKAELDAFHEQGEEEIKHWLEASAPDGTPYYYKMETGTTRWDSPHDELLHHMKLRARMLTDLQSKETPKPASPRSPPSEREPLSPARLVEQHWDLAAVRVAAGGAVDWPCQDRRGGTETPKGRKHEKRVSRADDAGVEDPGMDRPPSPISPRSPPAKFNAGFGKFDSGIGKLNQPERDLGILWNYPDDD